MTGSWFDGWFGGWRCNCTVIEVDRNLIPPRCPEHGQELLGPVQHMPDVTGQVFGRETAEQTERRTR